MNNVILSRELSFKAYHSHKGMMYEPHHSHVFKVVVSIHGEINEEGFTCDFRAIKRIVNKVVIKKLDNADLDHIFMYATSENLAVWIWKRLEKFFPLYSIEVHEKEHSKVVFFGNK